MKREGKTQKDKGAENGEGSKGGRVGRWRGVREQESALGNSLSSLTAIDSHLSHFRR